MTSEIIVSSCNACGVTGVDVKHRVGSNCLLCSNCIGVYMDTLDIEISQITKTDLLSAYEHDRSACLDPLTPIKSKCTNCIKEFFNSNCGCDEKLRVKTCSFCKTEGNRDSHPNDLPQIRKGSKLVVCHNCIKLYQRRLKEIDPEDTPCELSMEDCLKEGSKCPTHVVEYFETKIGVIRETDRNNGQVVVLEANKIPNGAVFTFKRTAGSEVTVIVGDILGEPGAHGAAYFCKREGKPAAAKFFFGGDAWFKEIQMVQIMKQAGVTNAYIDVHSDLPLGYTMVLYGKSINEFLAKRPTGYSFPFLSSVSFCYQLTVNMMKLVSHNLVHSDIGESNICLAKDGVKVWLIDYTDSKIVLAGDRQRSKLMRHDYDMYAKLYEKVAHGHSQLIAIVDRVEINQYDLKASFPYEIILGALDKIQFSHSAKLNFEDFEKISDQ